MAIRLYRFLDVSAGLQAGQFGIGERSEIASPRGPRPRLQASAGRAGDRSGERHRRGRPPELTPLWFGYDGDKVLINVAAHRKKTAWIRANPEISLILVNPANPYHWVSMKATVDREISEDDPDEGHRATEHIDAMWTKYTGAEPPYGLRDPSIDERRVLFEFRVDKVSTFGQPG